MQVLAPAQENKIVSSLLGKPRILDGCDSAENDKVYEAGMEWVSNVNFSKFGLFFRLIGRLLLKRG